MAVQSFERHTKSTLFKYDILDHPETEVKLSKVAVFFHTDPEKKHPDSSHPRSHQKIHKTSSPTPPEKKSTPPISTYSFPTFLQRFTKILWGVLLGGKQFAYVDLTGSARARYQNPNERTNLHVHRIDCHPGTFGIWFFYYLWHFIKSTCSIHREKHPMKSTLGSRLVSKALLKHDYSRKSIKCGWH